MTTSVDFAALSSAALRHWPLEAIKTIHLEMGMQCNVRCAMCFQTDFRPSTVLSQHIWEEKLRPVYETGHELTLVGGEPTVLPNCRALLELVTRNFPHLQLITATNGIRFTGLWAESFLRQGAYLNFSLNSVRPETYRRLVQFGQFDKAVANIDHMVHRKRETGSSLVIRVSAVVSDETVDELPEIVQWAADHGLDQVTLDPDWLGRLTRHAPADVQAKIAEAYSVADRYPHLTLLRLWDVDRRFAMSHSIPPVRPHPLTIREPVPCNSPFDTLHVSVDGSVHACCLTWYSYGNLNTASLADLWQGQAAYRFRRRMQRLDFRDCWTGCDRNACPIHPGISRLRQGWSAIRRDPLTAAGKIARTLGWTTARVRSRDKLSRHLRTNTPENSSIL